MTSLTTCSMATCSPPEEEVLGPVLKLWKVSRMDMGAYMCIAKVGALLGRPSFITTFITTFISNIITTTFNTGITSNATFLPLSSCPTERSPACSQQKDRAGNRL